MRAVSAAEDGHQHAPAATTSFIMPGSLELRRGAAGHGRTAAARDRKLKARRAGPAPGTIVASTHCNNALFGACSCPVGFAQIRITSDKDFWYYLCVAGVKASL